jgi:hypothetical protein
MLFEIVAVIDNQNKMEIPRHVSIAIKRKVNKRVL